MSVRTLRRIALHLATLAAVGSIAACAGDHDPLAPTSAAHVAAPSRARHDDTPPATPCSSGWLEIDGVWVCENP